MCPGPQPYSCHNCHTQLYPCSVYRRGQTSGAHTLWPSEASSDWPTAERSAWAWVRPQLLPVITWRCLDRAHVCKVRPNYVGLYSAVLLFLDKASVVLFQSIENAWTLHSARATTLDNWVTVSLLPYPHLCPPSLFLGYFTQRVGVLWRSAPLSPASSSTQPTSWMALLKERVEPLILNTVPSAWKHRTGLTLSTRYAVL